MTDWQKIIEPQKPHSLRPDRKKRVNSRLEKGRKKRAEIHHQTHEANAPRKERRKVILSNFLINNLMNNLLANTGKILAHEGGNVIS